MNIFKSITLTWQQIAAFRLSIAALGIAVGAYWHDFFAPYLVLLLIVAVVLGAYVAFVWLKQ